MILSRFGSNIQILLNTQNCGGMKSIRGNLRIIKSQRELKIGGNSQMSSRRLNIHF